MNCRTSPQKLARSCATNIFWDTARVINHTMRDGERSRSRCAPPRDFRLSASTQKQATTLPASRLHYSHVQFLFGIVCGVHSSHSARLQNVIKHSAESRMLYTILEESFWLPSKPATRAPKRDCCEHHFPAVRRQESGTVLVRADAALLIPNLCNAPSSEP